MRNILHRWTTEKLLTVGFVAALLVLALTGAVALRSARNYEASAGWVDHTRLVRNEIIRVQLRIELAESIGRRFFLTGNEADLSDLPGLRVELDNHLQKLRTLTRDNSGQQAHLDEVDRLVRQRLELLDERVKTRREGGLDAVVAAMRDNRAVQLMHKVRAELGAMDAIEEQLLNEHLATTRRIGRQAVSLILASIVLGISLVAFAGWRVFRDLRERRRAELVLAKSEASFRQLADATPQIVYTANAEGRIDYINRRGEEFLGLTPEELYEWRWGKAIHPDDLDLTLTAWHAAVRDGTLFELESRLRDDRDGRYYWHLHRTTPLCDGEGRIIKWFGTSTDIDAHKKAEAEIQALNVAMMARNQELAAANHELEAFSYSVSHDLRAPLRHIHGFINLLQRETVGELNDKAAHYQRVIAQSAQEMGRLIDDLLGFARLGRVELQLSRVELRPLMEQVRVEQDEAAGGRAIDWRIGDLPAVLGDPALLVQVVRNLMGNAVKFTAGRDSARIEISALPRGNGLAGFVVRDNGAGFDEKYADNLFKVFQRLHSREKFEGTGVGLATVRRIITRLGGTIHATAAVNEGATFFIRLPAASTPEVASTPEEEGVSHVA